jgi:glycosyltransferase involved in cell wall biosynthesis
MASSVLGISFDGLAISGIVSEFLNLAEVLRADGCRVLFDLGFDIKLVPPPESTRSFFPHWIELTRAAGDSLPERYSDDLVQDAFDRVVNGTSVAEAGIYDDVCSGLASGLVATFEKQNIRFLDVENGTLPDNPLFTEALYLAIAEYGARQKLGKYVLWRDFDLMWSAEPHLYGSYPYPGVRKPAVSPHIHYAVVTDWMRRRMEAWAPGPQYHVIPDRFFTSADAVRGSRSLRAAYGIPEDAYLVARCTRIIPQKSIERDLRVLDALQRRLAAGGNRRPVFLFVAGLTREEPEEFEHLRALEQTLSIAGQIVWANGLLPFKADPNLHDDRFSIRDLLAESNLSSFLTTYDYEGFGNPPGEAMAMGVPFMATTYELYQEVYGGRGAVGPLLSIDRTSTPTDPIPEDFLAWVLRVLTNGEYRKEVVERNLEVCRRYFSLDALERQIREIFDF